MKEYKLQISVKCPVRLFSDHSSKTYTKVQTAYILHFVFLLPKYALTYFS